jgi:hypothetical protein
VIGELATLGARETLGLLRYSPESGFILPHFSPSV